MNWKIIGKSLGHPEMRKRILAVLGILLVFRVLSHIPVPLSDPTTLKQVLETLFTSTDTPQLLNFINILSGGALANFSIMIAGLGPYINASIIMQLLTKAIPKLEAMRKDGESGQRRINQYTRVLTFPLAILQAIGAIYLVRSFAQQYGGVGDITANASIMDWALMVAALTGGSMLLMWLGEQITERSIGNGISLLITAGIIASLPGIIASLGAYIFASGGTFTLFDYTFNVNGEALVFTAIIAVVVVLVTWMVVKLNEAARRLTVNYAKRVQGNRTYGGITTTLPVKLISAGVIPIIFAVAFLSVPSFVGQLMVNSDSARMQEIGLNLVTWFQTPTTDTLRYGGWEAWIYPSAYFLLVFMFTFFYTSITFNSKEIAENLQKQGGFIEGVRSGLQTEHYLSKISGRLTLFGAMALSVLAIMPIVGHIFIPDPNIAIGGTTVLILVSVSLETLRAVESRALMVTYDQYSQPDFFHDLSTEDVESPKKRRFSLIPFRRKK
ncbi:preprotein translocase subunit SecY [Candidatus Saccharibacteria bacterium]|nr:preprotein translocase subunit SecY [Candidatus Saccharibacteria bacterium]